MKLLALPMLFLLVTCLIPPRTVQSLGLSPSTVSRTEVSRLTDMLKELDESEVLKEEERGLANGLMFGGAYLGQTIGGAGVLFLSAYIDFRLTFFFVAAWILAVTLFVALPLKEPTGEPRPAGEGPPLRVAFRRIGRFLVDVLRAFFGSRGGLIGLVFAALPAGAYALGLALQSALAVELVVELVVEPAAAELLLMKLLPKEQSKNHLSKQ